MIAGRAWFEVSQSVYVVLIKTLGEHHAELLVFRSSCPICQEVWSWSTLADRLIPTLHFPSQVEMLNVVLMIGVLQQYDEVHLQQQPEHHFGRIRDGGSARTVGNESTIPGRH